MADEKGTTVSPQEQASASGPKNPEPQDNGSETDSATSVPTAPKNDAAENDAKEAKEAKSVRGAHAARESGGGRATGLHR